MPAPTHATQSIVRRARKRLENMRKAEITWLEVLARVNAASFKCHDFDKIPSSHDDRVRESEAYGNKWELIFLEQMAQRSSATTTAAVKAAVDDLITTQPVREMCDRMTAAGIASPLLHRWVVEIVYQALSSPDMYGSRAVAEAGKVTGRIVDELQDEPADTDESEDVVEYGSAGPRPGVAPWQTLSPADDAGGAGQMAATAATTADSARTEMMNDMAVRITQALQRQMIGAEGYYSGRVKALSVMRKVAMTVVRIGLASVFPAVGVTWIVLHVTQVTLGARPESLFPVVTQILMQRLILATQGITIDSYYRPQH